MSNVYEALLHAQWQQGTVEDPATPLAAQDALVAHPRATMEREMVELHLNVEALLPDTPRKIIQFTGSRAGEGVSTVVREYAWMATEKLGKSVLIIDTDQTDRGQNVFSHIRNRYSWGDAVRGQVAIDESFSRIDNTNLYVSGYSSRPGAAAQLPDSQQFVSLFERLRVRFDLVLIDSPSSATGLDALVLARCVDGVILVVEAEKTRWPIVESVKNRIVNNGGKILGTVFNKRRNYIPEFIYSRL